MLAYDKLGSDFFCFLKIILRSRRANELFFSISELNLVLACWRLKQFLNFSI